MKLKRETEKECIDAHNKYMKETISTDNCSNSKRFWSYIKSKRCENSGVSALTNNNGILPNDSHGKAKNIKWSSHGFYRHDNTNKIPDKGPNPQLSFGNIQRIT